MLNRSRPAFHYRLGDRKGKFIDERAVRPAAYIEGVVVVQMAARHRAFHLPDAQSAVSEEIARTQRNILRLIVHILPATSGEEGPSTTVPASHAPRANKHPAPSPG